MKKRNTREGGSRRHRFFLFGTVAAALLLVVLAVVLLRGGSGRAYRGYMQQAAESYQQEDYDSALRYLRKAAALEEDAECLMLMADCYEAQGKLDKALETLRRMDTEDSRVAQRIASIEQRRLQQAEAEKVTVAGLPFASDTTDLVLDNRQLRDADLAAVQQLYALDNLSLMDNDLTDISPLAELGGLDTLNLSGNRIADIRPLSALRGLRTLYLDGNPIEDFTPLYGLDNLTTLSIRGIPLDEEQLKLLTAALPGCAILSDADKGDAAELTLGGVSFQSDVSELKLNGVGIWDISALTACGELRWLSLRDNEISDLQPLMNLPGLESLDIRGNAVSDLRPIMGLKTLRSLDAAENQITDTAAVGAMTALTSLNLSNNPIGDFSGLKKLRNLQTLKLENTGLTDADLGYLEQISPLTYLVLDGNEGLSDEAVGRLQSALPGCTISHSELVYSVTLGGAAYRSDVTELDLSGLGLTELGGIERFTCLETLRLGRNELSNIYLLQYGTSRETMKTLDLSGNQIEDITALAALTELEQLDLSGNRVNSVLPLMKLDKLRRLDLSGNLLTEAQLSDLREALPGCEIIFY